MLTFGVYDMSMKRVKTLKAKQMSTIYSNYNKYCNQQGYMGLVPHRHSFGYNAWQNPQGKVLLLIRES